MDMRQLGSTGLVSSAIGLGTAAFTGLYGSVTRDECIRTIRVALDAGITMFDTADSYMHGEIERLVGNSLYRRRGDALIATHCGAHHLMAGESDVIDGSPAYVAAACDASLRRLRTDFIDLYYLSRVDPRVPIEDSVGMLADLVVAGKIRHVGLYEVSPDNLRRAQATHPISALAVEYSLLHRSAERRTLPVAAELGVGIVAYCPLARGLLTGVTSVLVPTDQQVALRAAQDHAAELDLGMARLALAWLLAWRNDIVAVPGTRSVTHVEMNASVSGIRLARDTCARLSGLFRP
jgi:aryl-alcohol dehydrogenase-like predicted oxidoreductase